MVEFPVIHSHGEAKAPPFDPPGLEPNEYMLVISWRGAKDFGNKVTALLEEGWELYGCPSSHQFDPNIGIKKITYIQAMVRKVP